MRQQQFPESTAAPAATTASSPPSARSFDDNHGREQLFLADSRDTIPAGNITFQWSAGAITHNVTWETGPGTLPAGSGNRADGSPDYVAALVAGDYTYHCTIHPTQMNGVIHVNP